MQAHSFIADSAADAVAQIRAQLGPAAIVLNVRKLPAEGISRLWQNPRIEVLAYVPEAPAPVLAANDALAELRQELAEIKQKVGRRDLRTPISSAHELAQGGEINNRQTTQRSMPCAAAQENRDLFVPGCDKVRVGENSAAAPMFGAEEAADLGACQKNSTGTWRVGKYLETTGLSALHAQRVVEQLCLRHGDTPPESFAKELNLTRALLTELWPATRPSNPSRVHIFVGAAGVGKTTSLCKWLAQSVLVEGRTAQVWRLDGRTANTAESLSVYCEILGVPLERFVPSEGVPAGAESLFIDLPGVNWADAEAICDLARRLGELPPAQVHLVLNAAYEMPVLLAQTRAFSALPVNDLIFTHLDEESRWGKLWNFVFGTNYSPAFLSAGQNVPGDFIPASAEKILSRQFPCR